jgi:DNA-binding beta-propeller fold protein YncE
MRALIQICVLLFSVTVFAGGDSVYLVSPEAGEEVSPELAPADVHLVHPRDADASTVRFLDSDGRPIDCRIESPTTTEKSILPTVPLGPGQYTVDLPDLGVVKSFTIGPDVYAPKLLSAAPAGLVERDTMIELLFTEAIDATMVNWETVVVRERIGDTTRMVPGKIRVDREGTRVTFQPVYWPGFTPEGDFEMVIEAGDIDDLAGNALGEQVIPFTGAAEPVTVGPPVVPRAVYWSSRTELGIVDLGLDSHGPFDATSVTVGDPKEIVIDPRVNVHGDGVAYGLNPRRHEVLILNALSGQVLQRIPLKTPSGIAVDPKGRWLFVSSKKEGTLVRFDAKLAHQTLGNGLPRDGEVAVGRKPAGVAVSPDGRFVACVSAKDRTVSVYETDSLSNFATFPTGVKPEDLAFVRESEDHCLLLVTCRGKGRSGGSVQVFDLEGCGQVGEIDGLLRPRRIAARGATAWVALEGEDRIARLTLSPTGRVEIAAKIPAGRRPVDVTPAPEGDDALFVVNRRAHAISVVSETAGGVTATVQARGALAVASWREN